MKDSWIAGTANTSYELKGPCPADFWSSAEGTLQFDMRNGSLPHVSLADDPDPLKVTRFAGQAHLHSGRIDMNDATLASPGEKFQLSGNASLTGELDLKLARMPENAVAPGFTITGTLQAPRVTPSASSETQARLKADAAK